MTEVVGFASPSVSAHPKFAICRDLLRILCMCESRAGRCQYIEGGEFLVVPVTPGNLSNWNQSHSNGYRCLSKDMSTWAKDDVEIFYRQMQSREFYFEVRSETVCIFKNKDSV